MDDFEGPEWDGIAQRVGRVAMVAAQLEYATADLVLTLVRSHLAMPVVMGQNWAATRSGADALLKERIGTPERPHFSEEETAFYENLREVLRRADALMTERNNVVHSMWIPPFDESEVYLAGFLWKRWGRAHGGDWTAEHLDKLRADIASCSGEITRAGHRIATADQAAADSYE